MIFTQSLCRASLLLAGLSLTGAVNAQTKMVDVVNEHGIEQCKAQLLTIAEDVIGVKEHRLHLDQPKGNVDSYPFAVIGVLTYNDREAQLQFTASPMGQGGCEVTSLEAFTIPETCVDVREQVFKKWKFVGRLSEQSFFLRHKEQLTRNATLTSTNSGAGCLVTRRHSGI